MINSFLSHLECSKCDKTYDHGQVNQLCSCGAPLLAEYDLKKVAGALRKNDLVNRPSSLWRYKELLPVRKEGNIITMGEGMTPLIPLTKAGGRVGMSHLFMKDEGTIPTGAFKARGAAVGISKARELGTKGLVYCIQNNETIKMLLRGEK